MSFDRNRKSFSTLKIDYQFFIWWWDVIHVSLHWLIASYTEFNDTWNQHLAGFCKTVDSQYIAPPLTSYQRPISALHGGKKSTSPDPVFCIIVWFCVDLDVTAYAHSKHAPWYAPLCAMHHTVMIRMYAWLGWCVRFAWRQCADTEGNHMVDTMGYIDRCRP